MMTKSDVDFMNAVICVGIVLLGWFPLLSLVYPILQRVRLALIYRFERAAEKRKAKR